MTKIVKAKIWNINLKTEFPGHDLIILELIGEDGNCGLGEIALAYGYGAQAAIVALEEVVRRLVIGRSAFDTRAIWEDIERKTYWAEGRNLILRGAQAAVDIALWDLKGQILKQPVYQLLGGKVRNDIELYCNHWYGEVHTPQDYAKKARRVLEDGYSGLKFDPFRMSPEGVFSVPPKPLPTAWGRLAIDRVKAVREVVGTMRIFIDCHATLSVSDAVKWGLELEKYDIAFYEEPVISYNPDETLEVKKRINAPIAGGERLYCKQDFYPFISQRAYDVVQPDIALAGGFTGLIEIATLARTKEIFIQPHNCAGPVCSAASVHFDMTTPNLLIQEWFPYWEDNRYQYVEGAYEPKTRNGRISPPDLPGLGLKLAYSKLTRFKCITIE